MDDIDYIYFKLKGTRFRIDPNNSYNLQKLYTKNGRRFVKKPYWRKVSIYPNDVGYLLCSVGGKPCRHHRIVYYAHNQDWNIDDSCCNNTVDHEDWNRSNNQISNLRLATQSQQQQNKNVKGCYFDTNKQRWIARINHEGKRTYIGAFLTEELARAAYLKAKAKYHPFYRGGSGLGVPPSVTT